jgi:2-polyprenyl-6-methoxyphenol hydroxylase-like FAD-dependent oxidoreductase
MAVEDAVVLADALASSPDAEHAFSLYFDARHARTKAVVAMADANAMLLRSRAPLVDRLRDSLLGAVVSGGMLQSSFVSQIEGCPIPLRQPG